MFSLGNHELRLYRTCKAIHVAHKVRREWWQHLELADSLAWHLDPSKAQPAWDSFFAWQRYVHGVPLPVAVLGIRNDSDDENERGNAVVERCRTESQEYSPYSYSSCPESSPPESYASDFSEDFDNTVLEWVTGRPRLCDRCWQLPYAFYSLSSDDLYCYRCKFQESNQALTKRWSLLLRNHRVFGETVLTSVVVEILFGDGLHMYCTCGQCNPSWFPIGWLCPTHQPRQLITRANNHAQETCLLMRCFALTSSPS